MDTVSLYENGSSVVSIASNKASYVSMENDVAVVSLGVTDGNMGFFDGKMAGGPAGPFFTQKEFTADDVSALYQLGLEALGL